MTKNLLHLTKSKYVSGLRCERKLWLDVHDHGPYVDPPLGSVMDIGNRVGRGAHKLFPGGIEIEAAPWEHGLAVEQTKSLMEDEETPAIFEGAFEYNGIRIRVDVLERLGHKVWGLREVKSSLSVKEESGHFDDVAVQFYVLRGCGVKVPSVELIHINKQYLRGDPGIVWSELMCCLRLKNVLKISRVPSPIRWPFLPGVRLRMYTRANIYANGLTSATTGATAPQENPTTGSIIYRPCGRTKSINSGKTALKPSAPFPKTPPSAKLTRWFGK